MQTSGHAKSKTRDQSEAEEPKSARRSSDDDSESGSKSGSESGSESGSDNDDDSDSDDEDNKGYCRAVYLSLACSWL